MKTKKQPRKIEKLTKEEQAKIFGGEFVKKYVDGKPVWILI